MDNDEGLVRKTKRGVHRYGMGIMFATNIFGAGSVFILSEAGANHGYSLLWVLVLAFFLGMGMHEMAARLASEGIPLMGYISDVIGNTAGKVFSISLTFIMHFWSVANYAIAGAALVYLSPLSNLYLGIIITAVLGLALVELQLYERVEGVITILALGIFASYLVIVLGLDFPLEKVINGFIPAFKSDFGYLTMVIALMGTTIYYPNFFIQSSMKSEKEWDSLSRYRRDHTVGLVSVILLSIAFMIVAAATIPPGEITLTAPGIPLEAAIGSWALEVFVLGAGIASFTSATGTLFAGGFMVPQSFGKDVDFGHRYFCVVVEFFIVLSIVLSITILATTNFTPVYLAITMPAVNGAIGLPLTVVFLYMAVSKYFELTLPEKVYFLTVVVLMVVSAVFTVESLVQTIMSYL